MVDRELIDALAAKVSSKGKSSKPKPPEPEEPEEGADDEGEDNEDLEALMDRFMTAVDDKDPKAMADAFKGAVKLCC